MFMQIGATLVFATGNIIIANVLMSEHTLILTRSLAESIPILLKLFSGTISDIFPNKKVILLIGYGGIILCKLGMLFSTFTTVFSIALLSKVYIISLFIDRSLNSIRDIPREILLNDSAQTSVIHKSFGIRKIVASMGSIIGGILSFVLVSYKFSGTFIYSIAILPLILANVILYKLVHNINTETKTETKSKHIISILIYLIASNIIIYFAPYLSMIFGSKYFFEKKDQNYKQEICLLLFSGALFLLSWYFFKMIIIAGYVTFNFTFFINRLLSSKLYIQIKDNMKNKFFMHIGILSVLLSFGRINDTIYYTYGISLGFNVNITILFFMFYYISIVLGSLFFTSITKKVPIYIYILLISLFLFCSNIILILSVNKILFFASLFFVGLYSSGMELLLQVLISKSFNVAKGTMFGYFYTLNGISTIINALIITKLNNVVAAAKFGCLFPIIIFAYVMYTLKDLK